MENKTFNFYAIGVLIIQTRVIKWLKNQNHASTSTVSRVNSCSQVEFFFVSELVSNSSEEHRLDGVLPVMDIYGYSF